MANRHYTDPYCRALREKDYEKANEILQEHIKTGQKFTNDQAYYGLTSECRNLDLFWDSLMNIHLFKGYTSEPLSYIDVLEEVDNKRGSTRRLLFVYKKVLSEENLLQPLLDDVLHYANKCKNDNIVIKLIHKGASVTKKIENVSVLEDAINSFNKTIIDAIFAANRTALFELSGESGYDPIEDMAGNGFLEEFLGDKTTEMTSDEKFKYQSYLLKDLMSKDGSLDNIE